MQFRGQRRARVYGALLGVPDQHPATQGSSCRVDRDGGEPGARVAGNRSSLDRLTRLEERDLHDVLGFVHVVKFSVDEADQRAAMLPVELLEQLRIRSHN